MSRRSAIGARHQSPSTSLLSVTHSPDEGVADVADQVAEEGDDEDVDVADLAADGVRPPVGRHRGQSGHGHRQTCRQGGSASDLGTKLYIGMLTDEIGRSLRYFGDIWRTSGQILPLMGPQIFTGYVT